MNKLSFDEIFELAKEIIYHNKQYQYIIDDYKDSIEYGGRESAEKQFLETFLNTFKYSYGDQRRIKIEYHVNLPYDYPSEDEWVMEWPQYFPYVILKFNDNTYKLMGYWDQSHTYGGVENPEVYLVEEKRMDVTIFI